MLAYRFPVAFVSHGGGPWPIISLDGFDESERLSIRDYMQKINQIPNQKPESLLVFSAHWECPKFTINTNPNPKLLFDYYGFPDDAYTFKWPIKNDLSIIHKIKDVFVKAGMDFSETNKRDYDHGVFVPLILSYPDAPIPVIQISLNRNLSPIDHFSLGELLFPLRENGVFIIGSGNSYHNVGNMFNPTTKAINDSKQFNDWLKKALSLDADDRKKVLLDWENAPAARACHPREEHFIPLLVTLGAAKNDVAKVSWSGSINGTLNTAFHFES